MGTQSTSAVTSYTNALQQCNNIHFQATVEPPMIQVWCQDYSMNPGGGSNAKSAPPTSIQEHHADNANFLSIYPNPTSSSIELRYNISDDGNVKVELFNSIGQFLVTLYKGYKSAGDISLNVDIDRLDLQSGIYLVNITVGGITSQQKLIFNKN